MEFSVLLDPAFQRYINGKSWEVHILGLWLLIVSSTIKTISFSIKYTFKGEYDQWRK